MLEFEKFPKKIEFLYIHMYSVPNPGKTRDLKTSRIGCFLVSFIWSGEKSAYERIEVTIIGGQNKN